MTKEYYTSKRVIDIGCGPLGTLEWADNAAERVGADPLATSYQALTKGKHAMRYVTCNSESIPFEDGHFDIVSMFNSLDHVFDVDATIAELKRICRPGGDIMIIVELDQKPTITEPHSIGLSVLEAFPGFEVMHRSVYELGEGHNIYKGLLGRVARTSDAVPGVLCARLRKRVAQQPLEKSRRAS